MIVDLFFYCDYFFVQCFVSMCLWFVQKLMFELLFWLVERYCFMIFKRGYWSGVGLRISVWDFNL